MAASNTAIWLSSLSLSAILSRPRSNCSLFLSAIPNRITAPVAAGIAVIAKDVGEAAGENRADAEIGERPGGVFAAGAAAEIAPADKNAG